ncbi:MAG: tetratricopeptide repeat protein [Alphaproteobacteria bacterium]
MKSTKAILLVLILSAVAVAFSFFLMPRTPEMALIQMKDKHFEEALASYETQKASGDLSVEVVSKLTELYLQKSEVNKAIEVMEEYVAVNPRDLEARERLGTYYQYAQRTDDYLRNLEEINRLTPTQENLKTLADIYNFNSEYDNQAKTLKEIVTTQPDNNPQHYMDLAYIQAANKEVDEAIATLQLFKKQLPEKFSFDGALLLVSLLLDKGQEAEALAVATEWQAQHTDAYDRGAKLVNMLHYKGSPESAQKLIHMYSKEQIKASPELLQEEILLQIAQGREEEVYAELQHLHATGTMAPVLQERLLYLALVRDDEEVTNAVLEDIDLHSLSEPQLSVLAELAMYRGHKKLVERLQEDFPAEDAINTHPVLSAMLALQRRDRSADIQLAKLEDMDIGTSSVIQIARTCAIVNRKDCAVSFLNKLPHSEDATNADIAAAAEIYLELRAWDEASELLARAQDRQSPALTAARLKLAAATGDVATIDNWLNKDSKDANPRLMADMFFLALNNGQHDMATLIAERFHAQENSTLSRTALSQAYIKTGQYEQAVNLLRDSASRTNDDEANYLFALAKLSASNPAYRDELAQYAASQLRSDMPRKQKMALVYALITAKQVEPAMPYIRELALSEGGSWASLYAETLDKQGRHAESREFWVSYASQSSTPHKDRLAAAYTLLGNGYKADAEKIFSRMAQGATADSQEVRGLVYLWGSRPAPEQVEWVASRMRASSGEERAKWAKLLADITSDETILWLAERTPDNLASEALVQRYTEALARSGQLEAEHAKIETLARKEGRTDLLHYYAKATQGAGYYQQSGQAYDTLFELGKGTTPMMREAAIVGYNQSDYSSSIEYLHRYLEVAPEERVHDPKAYEAYFIYAELLRREKLHEEMVPYYQASLDALAGTPHDNDPEILSRKAQSLIWSGQTKAGVQAFETAMQRYPNNDILRADYANTLIEMKEYAAARELLEQPPAAARFTAEAQNPVNATLNGTTVPQYQLVNGNTELVLHVPAGEKAVINMAGDFKKMPGIAYASEGYDTLLLGAAPGSKFDVKQEDGKLLVTTVPGHNNLELQGNVQTVLRYEMLKARTELETGEVYAASDRLNVLVPQYEDNATLLGFTANAENYGGNWSRAQSLLRRAHALSPANEDIIELDKAIEREYAPGAKLDFEWIRRGNDDEYISTASGYGYVNDNLLLGLIVQNNRILVKNERLADGRVGNFDGNRQRGEIYAIYNWAKNFVKGALFTNNDTFGAGVVWGFLNPLGETAITADYHRPYWNYTPSVLDDTTRDFVGVMHTVKPTPEFSLSAGPGYVRYNTDFTNDVFSGITFNLAAVYRLIDEQPFLAITYGIDAEYEIDHKKGFDSTGAYTPLAPMRSRELHFLALNAGYDFSEHTYGDVIVGWGVDRLGGHGPSIEGRLTHEINESFDAQIRASYGLDAGRSDDSLTRLGAYIRWKY